MVIVVCEKIVLETNKHIIIDGGFAALDRHGPLVGVFVRRGVVEMELRVCI